ncbi:MAG: Mrp/NBP35 family ATP-binding protein [Clostridia bacterium]
MSDCSGNCSSCSEDCKDRDLTVKSNEFSNIKKVYAVVSGKGGVGKSTVTSCLGVAMQNCGKQTAILDADITGPSIPKMFGIHGKAMVDAVGLIPRESKSGIRVMSVNLLLDSEETPVVWRGPVISSVIKQFYTDVSWGDVDCMFVDMPPGTGDATLTVFQSLKIDGIIVVTTPQDLVSMIVTKAVKMAQMMNVPIVGIVENMSYFVCDECEKKHFIFGESTAEKVAEANDLHLLASLPINKTTASLADKGAIELADTDEYMSIIDKLLK